MNSPRIIILLLLFASIGLVGCGPLITIEQPQQINLVPLQSGQSIGQTFTAEFAGLQELIVYIEPDRIEDGRILLDLRESPGDSKTLITSTRELSDLSGPGYYKFTFESQADSTNKDYYAELEIDGNGSVLVGVGDGDSYMNGSLYVNQNPSDNQLAFRFGYDRIQVGLGLIKEGLYWFVLVLAAIFLFVVPAWILLSLFWDKWRGLHWGEKLGFSIGLSLVIYPVLFLWTDVVGLHLGWLYVWLPILFSFGLMLWHKRKDLYPIRIPKLKLQGKIKWSDFTLGGIILLILLVRFWVIRTIDYPLWGDGYQHTMITQLLIDNKGLFSSWEPYAELSSFTYHFGFHTSSAVFQQLTGLPTGKSVLWTGQILNAFAVLTLFPLALRIRRNVWSGIVTLLIAGLLFTFPLYYVNWGRYTQLSGLAVLAVFACFAWEFIGRKKFDWSGYLFACLTLAGLGLSHYRILIFGLLFLLTYLLFFGWTKGFGRCVGKIFWLGVGSFVLFLPWFVNVFGGKLFAVIGLQLGKSGQQLSETGQLHYAIGDIAEFLPIGVWVVLPILIGWGIWRRKIEIGLVALWWLVIFLLANPQLLRLPGASYVVPVFTVMIATFFPAALLIGEFFGWLYERIQYQVSLRKNLAKIIPIGVSGVSAIIVISLGIYGLLENRSVLDTYRHALVTRPDVRAAGWIEQNLDKDSIVLVNSFFAYGDTLIVGSDGGWWLPMISLRGTTLPPLSYGAEQGPFPGYVPWTGSLTRLIEEKGINHPEVMEMLAERGITNLYIGQRRGSVNSDDALLNVDELLESSNYEMINNQDRVMIFAVKSRQQ